MAWYKIQANRLFCMNCIPIRRKHKSTHWSIIEKRQTPKDKALRHFDDLYKSFYGSEWPSMRVALLSQSKYCAVVNNFGDSEETIDNLKKLGVVDIHDVFKGEVEYEDNLKKSRWLSTKKLSGRNKKSRSSSLNSSQQSENNLSVTPIPVHDLVRGADGAQLSESSILSAASLRSQLSNPEIEYDRIVKPDMLGGVVSTAALHEFVPATKLKGMEDWISESEHFSGYQESLDFPIIKKEEEYFYYPQHWKIFSHIRGDVSEYPHPRRGKAGVYNYYLLDAASILPVLALDITQGDRVLDMCAALGEKSYLILQTLYPECVVSNDVQLSRVKRMEGVLGDHFFKLRNWKHQITVTQRDGCIIDEENVYNKILVDVPCTTDRHTVMENDNNIFNPSRIKERILLPSLQTELLSNAMKIVSPGGTVVYSTCTLSPVQNDGVVHMALKKNWEERQIEMEVRDMTHALRVTKNVFKFSTSKGLRYGNVVVPFLANNFGPTYFCKLVKKK